MSPTNMPMPDVQPVRPRPGRATPWPAPTFAWLSAGLAVLVVAACADDVTTPGRRAAEGGSAPLAAVAADRADPCGATTVTLATPGQALAVTDTVLCVSGGGTGAEYALVPVNGGTNPRRSALVSVTPAGVVAPNEGVAAEPAADVLRSAVADRSPGAFAAALEARRLAAGRALVRPRMQAARRWLAARNRRGGAGAQSLRRMRAADGEPLAVGQILQINTNTDDPCESPTLSPARIVALSKRAIVLADEANPSGGFTDADYQDIAATFDSIIDPVDRLNFGDPTDIDENGRAILFFTRAVNALTPPGSNTYVAGFFWVRDLLPNLAGPDIPEDWVCTGSNAGEMFYLMVPDPSGEVNGLKFGKAEVEDLSIVTVGHEYEHLINASRRVYINEEATELEETWLDEGLAHSAEELIFYARSGLTPRANLDATGLRGTPSYLGTFNTDARDNFRNLERYLGSPSSNSPYADNDRLETRGATWSFLRFAVDHVDGAESDAWYDLVNAGPVGFANLRNVFGTNLPALFRNWSTSLLVDDLAGADARYQQVSWNFPSVFNVVDETSTYPLRTLSLSDGVLSTVRVTGGGAAFMRFGVVANSTAALRWDALPTGVTMTLVRLK